MPKYTPAFEDENELSSFEDDVASNDEQSEHKTEDHALDHSRNAVYRKTKLLGFGSQDQAWLMEAPGKPPLVVISEHSGCLAFSSSKYPPFLKVKLPKNILSAYFFYKKTATSELEVFYYDGNAQGVLDEQRSRLSLDHLDEAKKGQLCQVFLRKEQDKGALLKAKELSLIFNLLHHVPKTVNTDWEKVARKLRFNQHSHEPRLVHYFDIQKPPFPHSFRLIVPFIAGQTVSYIKFNNLSAELLYFIALIETLEQYHAKGLLVLRLKDPSLLLNTDTLQCHLISSNFSLKIDEPVPASLVAPNQKIALEQRKKHRAMAPEFWSMQQTNPAKLSWDLATFGDYLELKTGCSEGQNYERPFYYEIAVLCKHSSPSKRPSFQEIKRYLELTCFVDEGLQNLEKVKVNFMHCSSEPELLQEKLCLEERIQKLKEAKEWDEYQALKSQASPGWKTLYYPLVQQAQIQMRRLLSYTEQEAKIRLAQLKGQDLPARGLYLPEYKIEGKKEIFIDTDGRRFYKESLLGKGAYASAYRLCSHDNHFLVLLTPLDTNSDVDWEEVFRKLHFNQLTYSPEMVHFFKQEASYQFVFPYTDAQIGTEIKLYALEEHLRFALALLDQLLFYHAHGLVVTDLKTNNFLYHTKKHQLRLIDGGSAQELKKIVDSTFVRQTDCELRMLRADSLQIAPEAFSNNPETLAELSWDIHGFGYVVNELCINAMTQFQHPLFIDLIERCKQKEIAKRPDLKAVHHYLSLNLFVHLNLNFLENFKTNFLDCSTVSALFEKFELTLQKLDSIQEAKEWAEYAHQKALGWQAPLLARINKVETSFRAEQMPSLTKMAEARLVLLSHGFFTQIQNLLNGLEQKYQHLALINATMSGALQVLWTQLLQALAVLKADNSPNLLERQLAFITFQGSVLRAFLNTEKIYLQWSYLEHLKNGLTTPTIKKLDKYSPRLFSLLPDEKMEANRPMPSTASNFALI